MTLAVMANSKQRVARGIVTTVMLMSVMIIISIDTIISMIW